MAEEKQALNAAQISALNDILKSADLSKVTSETAALSNELDDAYYLSKVLSAELGTSKKGNMQVALIFQTVENGLKDSEEFDTQGKPIFTEVPKTKGKRIYKYYPLKDKDDVQKFVTDMLKFEENGQSILPKTAFERADTLEDALLIIETMQVYVNVSNTRDSEGKITNTWYNLISWKRATQLELPVD